MLLVYLIWNIQQSIITAGQPNRSEMSTLNVVDTSMFWIISLLVIDEPVIFLPLPTTK